VEQIIFATFEKAYRKFPHRIKKPNVLLMGKWQFRKFLRDSLLETDLYTTPAVIAHTPNRDIIIFCPEIIESLKPRNLRRFIEAIVMHELYHEWNRHRIESRLQALESEMQVDIELKNDFPQLHKELKGVIKKLINKRERSRKERSKETKAAKIRKHRKIKR